MWLGSLRWKTYFLFHEMCQKYFQWCRFYSQMSACIKGIAGISWFDVQVSEVEIECRRLFWIWGDAGVLTLLQRGLNMESDKAEYKIDRCRPPNNSHRSHKICRYIIALYSEILHRLQSPYAAKLHLNAIQLYFFLDAALNMLSRFMASKFIGAVTCTKWLKHVSYLCIK